MKEIAIKEICKKDSSSLKQKELKAEGKYPVYGASGIAGYLNSYHQENAYIGIVKDGSGIGRVAFYPEKSSLIGTMQYILPKAGYDIRYIGYCLQSLDLSKYKQGAAIPHIYFRDYGERQVKVSVDIDEQKRIVERLDSAFENIDKLKANAEKQLAEARTLFQKSLAKAMEPKEGWEEKKLGQVCEITSSKRIFKNEYTECGVPFYRTKELKELAHNQPISLELFISNSKYLEIKEKYGVPVIGDILISAVGTIGETLIIRDNSPFYFKDGNIVWLRNIQGVDPHFLKIALDSIVDNLKGVTRGAAYNALTIEKLKQIDFFFPKTLAEQQRIVERLDSLSENVRKYEEIQRQIISECDALKQALLRKVFE